MSCSLKPLDDRVVVELLDEEEKTPGGLFIPEKAREKSKRGKVLAVGPGRWNENTGTRHEMTVKVGDLVLIGQYGVKDVEMDGKKLKIVREGDVMAVLEGEDQ